jgi:hypothetical protein
MEIIEVLFNPIDFSSLGMDIYIKSNWNLHNKMCIRVKKIGVFIILLYMCLLHSIF